MAMDTTLGGGTASLQPLLVRSANDRYPAEATNEEVATLIPQLDDPSSPDLMRALASAGVWMP